jgi:ribosomal protein S18 acetylase RimI-like enzyme
MKIDAESYHVVRAPKLTEQDLNINALAEKFREFRLRSLKNAPDAFASTYEVESQRGLDQSIGRLVSPKATHFVVLRSSRKAIPSEGDAEILSHLLEDYWAGMVVLLGPEEGNEFSVPSANIDPFGRMTASKASTAPEAVLFEPSEDPKDMHFHINGTFVDPSARGSGLGGRLMDAAIKDAEEEAAKVERVMRLTLSVFSHNPAARKVYEKSGFRVVKEAPARSKPGFVAIHMQLEKPVMPVT